MSYLNLLLISMTILTFTQAGVASSEAISSQNPHRSKVNTAPGVGLPPDHAAVTGSLSPQDVDLLEKVRKLMAAQAATEKTDARLVQEFGRQYADFNLHARVHDVYTQFEKKIQEAIEYNKTANWLNRRAEIVFEVYGRPRPEDNEGLEGVGATYLTLLSDLVRAMINNKIATLSQFHRNTGIDDDTDRQDSSVKGKLIVKAEKFAQAIAGLHYLDGQLNLATENIAANVNALLAQRAQDETKGFATLSTPVHVCKLGWEITTDSKKTWWISWEGPSDNSATYLIRHVPIEADAAKLMNNLVCKVPRWPQLGVCSLVVPSQGMFTSTGWQYRIQTNFVQSEIDEKLAATGYESADKAILAMTKDPRCEDKERYKNYLKRLPIPN